MYALLTMIADDSHQRAWQVTKCSDGVRRMGRIASTVLKVFQDAVDEGDDQFERVRNVSALHF